MKPKQVYLFDCISTVAQIHCWHFCCWNVFICCVVSATQHCWLFHRRCKTAVCIKCPAATGTTGCLCCAGSIPAPKQCCCAPEAFTARVWWDCSSRRTPLQPVSFLSEKNITIITFKVFLNVFSPFFSGFDGRCISRSVFSSCLVLGFL